MKIFVRIFCIFTVFFALAAHALGAATINVEGIGGIDTPPLLLAISGPPVPVGSRVMVGYFAGLTDSEIIADQTNPVFLESTFIAFGPGGAVGDGTGEPPAAGRFTFSTRAFVEPPTTFTAPTSPNNNQQIYIWTFDSNNLPTDAANQAIFTIAANAPAQQVENWKWPTTDDGSTDRSISLEDSLSMLVGGSNPNGTVFMVAIAEPEPWALFGFGMVGLLVLRRVAASGSTRRRPNVA